MTDGERVEFVHRSWPADPWQLAIIRRELADWLTPLSLTSDEIDAIVLAVDEAAANAMCHAYGPRESGVVELTLWTERSAAEGSTLYIEVVDHGRWRTPAAGTRGGRGIPLMNAMTDAVLIHFDQRGSRVLLRHRVPAHAPGSGPAGRFGGAETGGRESAGQGETGRARPNGGERSHWGGSG